MQLARTLVGAGVPVTALRVFGSGARGHSDEHSDLDVAVVLACPPDPSLTRRVLDLGHAVSIETDGQGLRVQTVPFFTGEDSGSVSCQALPSGRLWVSHDPATQAPPDPRQPLIADRTDRAGQQRTIEHGKAGHPNNAWDLEASSSEIALSRQHRLIKLRFGLMQLR